MVRHLGLVLAATGVLAAAPAGAAQLKQVGTIAVPGEPLAPFDIGVVDQDSQRYYLADRTNKSLDIFDAKTDAFLGRVPGFVGQKESNDVSGPDGVVVVGGEAWVGDGDSTVKVVDLATNKIVATISTGGKARVDEMAYDPVDHVFAGVNNADDPPFITLISTGPDRKILAKIEYKDATDGAEQPFYLASTGMIYDSIPQIGPDKATGAVAEIDPRQGTLVRMLPVANCHPAGLVGGPGDNLLLGCGAGDKEGGLPPLTVVIDARSGAVVKEIPGIGASDMVAYDRGLGLYYTASRNMPGGPKLGVIDAKANALVQAVELPGGNPHSVAVNETSHHVYVPLGVKGGGCGGCIGVFAPE
jgi:DNA-binding beta-propeller fold protein YncE